MIVQHTKKEEKSPVTIERERILVLIMENSSNMTQDYRNTIKQTGGLLTNSMAFAYARGINDVLKLITANKEPK